MSNDKNGRKEQGKILATIIILALATVFAIKKDLKSNESSPKEDPKPYVQEENKPKEDSKPYVQEESKPKEEPKQNVEEQEKSTETIQSVEGTLELTMIDQTTPNMIQRIIGIFERKPLISKEI